MVSGSAGHILKLHGTYTGRRTVTVSTENPVYTQIQVEDTGKDSQRQI
ncbi:MAG: hypothetical protein ACLUKO_04070 [Enterocloster bolteae]